MRTAPPAVDVTLGSGRRERALVGALYALASALLMHWLGMRLSWPPTLAWAAVVSGLMAGAWAGWWVLSPLTGRLRWDGTGWTHLPPAGAGRALQALELRIDLGGWLLLRARHAGQDGRVRVGWCGIGARVAGAAAWHGLRLALHHGGPYPADPRPPAGEATV